MKEDKPAWMENEEAEIQSRDKRIKRYIRLVSRDCPQGEHDLERIYGEALEMKERFEEFDLQYQEMHPVKSDLPKAQKHRTTEDKLDLLCINQIEMEKDINCITDEINWIRDAIAATEKSTEEINKTLKNMEVWIGEFCKFYCNLMDEERDKEGKQ